MFSANGYCKNEDLILETLTILRFLGGIVRKEFHKAMQDVVKKKTKAVENYLLAFFASIHSFYFNVVFYTGNIVLICFSLQLLGNDTTEQFNNLKVNLSDVNVLSNETRNSLIDLSNSGVDQIEFDAFLNEVMFYVLFYLLNLS